MFSPDQVRNEVERRSVNEGQESMTHRPLSLTAGPALTWLYVIGNPEAAAIVEDYRPRFTVRLATERESIAW